MNETKPTVGPGEQGDRLREALIEAMTYLFCNCHVRCSECKHDFVVYGAGVSKPTLDALKAKADAALAAHDPERTVARGYAIVDDGEARFASAIDTISVPPVHPDNRSCPTGWRWIHCSFRSVRGLR